MMLGHPILLTPRSLADTVWPRALRALARILAVSVRRMSFVRQPWAVMAVAEMSRQVRMEVMGSPYQNRIQTLGVLVARVQWLQAVRAGKMVFSVQTVLPAKEQRLATSA